MRVLKRGMVHGPLFLMLTFSQWNETTATVHLLKGSPLFDVKLFTVKLQWQCTYWKGAWPCVWDLSTVTLHLLKGGVALYLRSIDSALTERGRGPVFEIYGQCTYWKGAWPCICQRQCICWKQSSYPVLGPATGQRIKSLWNVENLPQFTAASKTAAVLKWGLTALTVQLPTKKPCAS